MLRGLRDTTMIQHDVNMADPGGTDSDRPALRVLKFELQLYKLRDGEYCIDVQVGTRLLQFRFQGVWPACDLHGAFAWHH